MRAGTPFSEEERDAVYRAIFTRRDVRSEFLPDPIVPEILSRILLAGHHAPSVGFMQPWDFIVITDAQQKRAIKALFDAANREAAPMFDARQSDYQALKLEGIVEAPVNLCITCSRERSDGPVLGRTHMREMDLYSTVCAVQNMWLAARAEGIGMGWVSIFHPEKLAQHLGIPQQTQIVAYLCLGHVSALHESPELAKKGWANRTELAPLLHQDRWNQPGDEALIRDLSREAESFYAHYGTR